MDNHEIHKYGGALYLLKLYFFLNLPVELSLEHRGPNHPCLHCQVTLKDCTRVMLLHNKSIPDGLVNGRRGTVIAMHDDHVDVRFDHMPAGAGVRIDYEVRRAERDDGSDQTMFATRSQISVGPAYGSSVHKLQGKNCDSPIGVDITQVTRWSEEDIRALILVGLSRATSADLIKWLRVDIPPSVLSACQRKRRNESPEAQVKRARLAVFDEVLSGILMSGLEERKARMEDLDKRNILATLLT